jgi:hypothetical protein
MFSVSIAAIAMTFDSCHPTPTNHVVYNPRKPGPIERQFKLKELGRMVKGL